MIVVGGGASTRFGEDKLMADIDGRPLIEHTIDAVVSQVDVCVVVCRSEISGRVAELRPDVTVTPGGATRTRSEMSGIAAIGMDVDLIGIHDAARPLINGAMISRLFETAHAEGGAVPLLTYEELIVDRESHQPMTGLRGAQTPQVFRAAELIGTYQRAARAGFDGHDTVEVMQRFSDVRVVAIDGDPTNVKVTYPDDLDRVRASLSGPSRT